MKVTVEDPGIRTWKPINVTITLGSVQEARLLMWAYRMRPLRSCLSDIIPECDQRNEVVAPTLEGRGWAALEEAITAQGFKTENVQE